MEFAFRGAQLNSKDRRLSLHTPIFHNTTGNAVFQFGSDIFVRFQIGVNVGLNFGAHFQFGANTHRAETNVLANL